MHVWNLHLNNNVCRFTFFETNYSIPVFCCLHKLRHQFHYIPFNCFEKVATSRHQRAKHQTVFKCLDTWIDVIPWAEVGNPIGECWNLGEMCLAPGLHTAHFSTRRCQKPESAFQFLIVACPYRFRFKHNIWKPLWPSPGRLFSSPHPSKWIKMDQQQHHFRTFTDNFDELQSWKHIARFSSISFQGFVFSQPLSTPKLAREKWSLTIRTCAASRTKAICFSFQLPWIWMEISFQNHMIHMIKNSFKHGSMLEQRWRQYTEKIPVDLT